MSAPKGKGKQHSLVKTSTEVDIAPVVVKDFIAGKVSVKEWESLLEAEEGVETVCEIVNEVVRKASDCIYEKYLGQAAYGYAVHDAKEQLLNIIAMEFVGRDEGEGDTDIDPSWLVEDEPTPPPIDSWSTGTVPQSALESLLPPVEALSPVSIVRLDIPRSSEFRGTVDKETPPSSRAARWSMTRSSCSGSPSTKLKQAKSKRPKASVHRMVVLNKQLSDEEDNGGGEEAVNQEQDPVDSGDNERAPAIDVNAVSHTPFGLKPVQLKWMKEVKYDDNGRILEMVKLDPSKFPSHRTKQVVTIVQPQVSSYRQKRQSKLKPLSPQKAKMLPQPHPPKEISFPHSGYADDTRGGADTFYVKSSPGSKSRNEPTIKVKVTNLRSPSEEFIIQREAKMAHREARKVTVMPSGKGLSSEMAARRFPEVPTIPSLVDSIDPLPGVTVREGGRSVHGPTPISHPPVTPLEGLRPIRTPPQLTDNCDNSVSFENGENAKGAMSNGSHMVEFALPESSSRYHHRLQPARITS